MSMSIFILRAARAVGLLVLAFVGVATTPGFGGSGSFVSSAEVTSWICGGVGGTPAALTVSGSGFTTSSVIELDGTPFATTYVSASQLIAAIYPGTLASPVPQFTALRNGGPVSVRVREPNLSNEFVLSGGAAPALSSLSPLSVVVNPSSRLITLTGSGFLPGTMGSVTIDGTTCNINNVTVPLSGVTTTQATLEIPQQFVNSPGPLHIRTQHYSAGIGWQYSNALVVQVQSCVAAPISLPQTVVGTVSGDDCPNTFRGSPGDRYSFQGVAGQRISIDLEGVFDTYLVLRWDTAGVFADDDGGVGLNSRIPPESGSFTLPFTGTYTIEATGFGAGDTGSYTLRLNNETCLFTLSPTSVNLPATSSSTNVQVTPTLSSCSWSVSGAPSWVTISTATQTGSLQLPYTVAANTGPARSATLTIAGQPFTIQQASGCAGNTTLSAPGATHPSNGGTGSVTVTTSSGCSWSVINVPAWITISTAPQTGSQQLPYTVAANTGAARSATLTIAGQTYTIQQTGGCASNTTLSAPGATLPSSGGNGSVNVTAPSGCSWSVANVPAWITIQSPSGLQGSGSGTVSYSVSTNPTSSLRSAALSIGGQSYTVTQEGACSYSLTPTSASLSSAAGSTAFQVSTNPASCPWAPLSNDNWITATGTGPGNGTVNIVLAANSGPARTGTITVGTQTFTMQQEGAQQCNLNLSPATTSVTGSGGTGSFQVSGSCAYNAISEVAWIQVTSGAQGFGSGAVGYRVDSLSSGTRTGSIAVNGTRFQITQTTGSCTLDVSPLSLTAPAGGGPFAAIAANPQSCAWTASTSTPWITITAGANGSLTGVVSFTVQPNSGAQRSGTLQMAGRTVNVTQQSGAGCPVSLIPTQASFGVRGGSGVISLNSPCSWSASSASTWARLTSSTTGTGPANLTYTVDLNPGSTTRTTTLTIAGQSFPVTQAGGVCEFSLSTQSLAVPSAGATPTVQVATSPDCSWTVSESLPWVEILSGATGRGPGAVVFRVLPNTGVASLTGAVTVAGRSLSITQDPSQAFTCTAEVVGGAPAVLRAEGATELTANLQVNCAGNAPSALSGDILVRLNTALTSRIVSSVNDTTDALLFRGNPSTPIPGVNVYQGRLSGGNSVRFAGIPLANAGPNSGVSFLITNLRADLTVPDLGSDVIAEVEILPDLSSISVRTLQPLVVGRGSRSLEATFGAASGAGDITMPVTIRELLANTFRTRRTDGQDPAQLGVPYTSESGYVHSSILGPLVGAADTGTRFLLRLRNIPPNMRIFAPPAPAGGVGARLIAFDSTGAAVGPVTGAAPVEVIVIDGEAAITWEVTAANPASLDSFQFPLLFRNTTLAAVEQLRASAQTLLSPLPQPPSGTAAFLPQPVPRFSDPSRPRRRVALQVAGSLPTALPVASLRPSAIADATGTRSYELRASSGNNSDGEAAVAYTVRGNLSAGSSLTSCDPGRAGATCSVEGPDVVLRYPRLDPGERVVAAMSAELRDDAPGGSFVSFDVTGTSDFNVTTDSVRGCITGVSAFPQPPGSGASGSFTVWACGAWSLTSTVPWIVFTPSSGSGNAQVQYTVLANPGTIARNGVVTLPGATPINVQQLPAGPGNITGGGLRFVPLSPCRLLETRSQYSGNTWTGVYGPPRLAAGQTRTLPVAGAARCGVPTSAKAFVLNVTADTVEESTGPVDVVTIFPAGAARPTFATIRTSTGGYIANSAIVAAGTNGAVDIYTSNPVHLLIDISGYFTDDGAGLLYYPFGPCRAVDTRGAAYSQLPPPFGNSRMQARESRSFRLPAAPACAGLPSAAAYSLQMTLAPGPETNGGPVAYVTAWPTGQSQPIISNMNAYFGYAVANSGIVPASSSGSINVFAYDSTNVILDVNGYFAPDDGSGRGLYYFPVPQCRLLSAPNPASSPADPRTVSLPNGSCANLPTTARAFALNAWVTPNGIPMPFLSMWPAGTSWPNVSQLNAFQGQTVANSAIVPVNARAEIHLIVTAPTHVGLEASGYFARPAGN